MFLQVLQSHLEAVKGAPGEPQVFIEADPDGHGAYRLDRKKFKKTNRNILFVDLLL